MSHRTRALGLALTAVLVLSLSASAIGTVGAQTAGNDGPTPVLDAPDTIERGQLYELDGSDSTGDIEEYRWDYNPNAPTEFQRSSDEPDVYVYDRTDEGQDQFTVRLGVVDADGDVVWDEETITVIESESPNASIASSDDFTVEREAWERRDGGSWFNSTSTDNQGIRSCEWTFEYGPTLERHSGDGLGWGAGSTECRKNFSYAVPGTYEVTLNVTDWAGNSDTTTRTVEVVPKEPVTDDPQPNAELSGPDEVEWGATYWLDASNSTSEADVRYYIAETNPDVWKDDERNLGHLTSYGTVYDGQFDRIDVAVGVLTVDDQVDWAWKTIDVLEPEKPDAAIEGPDAVATGKWGIFDASNSTDNDRIRAYNWTFTDVETDETVHTDGGETGNYHFEEPGTYNVTVRVGDYVNRNRDAPYHYGVASKTVTVNEDGTVDDGDSGDETETETPDETETPEETETPDETDTPDDSDPPENSDPPGDDDASNDDDSPGDDDSSDDTSSSPSAPSGGSGGGAPPSDAEESDATVDVERVNASTSVVNVSDAPDDAAVEIDLDANASGDSVAYEGLDVHTDGNDTFSLTVQAHVDEPGRVTVDDVDGFDALSYLTVDGTDALDSGEAAVRFRVTKDRLDAADADAEHVALWRDVDGGSQAVETTLVNETEDAYVYRAEASAVPVYTIGVERPVLSVTDLAVDDEEPTAGDTVAVTATVVNAGEVAGSTNVSLAVDGQTTDERSVEVDARDSETVTFSVPVDGAAEHTLTAGDASATLSVAAQATATGTTDPTAGTTIGSGDATPGTSFGGVTGAGAVLVLVGIAGAALLAYRQ